MLNLILSLLTLFRVIAHHAPRDIHQNVKYTEVFANDRCSLNIYRLWKKLCYFLRISLNLVGVIIYVLCYIFYCCLYVVQHCLHCLLLFLCVVYGLLASLSYSTIGSNRLLEISRQYDNSLPIYVERNIRLNRLILKCKLALSSAVLLLSNKNSKLFPLWAFFFLTFFI